MKMLLKFKAVAACLLLCSVFYSCQNNEVIEDKSDGKDLQSMNFVYKGQKYESQYYADGDGVNVFLNDEVQQVADQLNQLPDLLTVVTEDGTVIYFDDEEEFNASFGRDEDNIALRAFDHDRYLGYAYASIYENNVCLGRNVFMGGNGGHPFYYTNLSTVNFDQKTSSLILWNGYNDLSMECWSILTLYSQVNFSGDKIKFVVSNREGGKFYTHYLSDYYIRAGSSVTWDNQARSVSVDVNEYPWNYLNY